MRGRDRAPVRNAGKLGLKLWEALYGGERPPPRNGKGSKSTSDRSEPRVQQKQAKSNSALVPADRQASRSKFGAPSCLVVHLLTSEAEQPANDEVSA